MEGREGGSTRLHPAMHSSALGHTAAPSACKLTEKRKISRCPKSSQWKSNVKPTSDRQAKQGQLGQGFLVALCFLNSSPWLLLGHPNEQWFERAGWVEEGRGTMRPRRFWGGGRVVVVQRAFTVERVFTQKLPFTETTETTEESRLNPEH